MYNFFLNLYLKHVENTFSVETRPGQDKARVHDIQIVTHKLYKLHFKYTRLTKIQHLLDNRIDKVST